jgi:hypothetical protein
MEPRMKKTLIAGPIALAAGFVLLLPVPLAVVFLGVSPGGQLGVRLSLAATALCFCSVVGLALFRRKQVLHRVETCLILMPRWHLWLGTVSGGAVGSVGALALVLVLREQFELRFESEHRLALGAALASFCFGTQIIQVALLSRFWPRSATNTCCATCGQHLFASQKRCPECGGERIIALEE